MNDFKKIEFVVLDVETTGLSPVNGDRVIEVAALKIRELKVVDRFYSLVDPKRPLSYGAFLVNGITEEMLRGAPPAPEILPGFLDFLGTACLVGHNIRFDLGFIKSEANLSGQQWRHSHPALDTVRLARWLIPELRRYRLQMVAQHLGIEDVQLHRAMADVELTMNIFQTMLEMAFRRDVSDLKGLLKYGGVKFDFNQQSQRTDHFYSVTADEAATS